MLQTDTVNLIGALQSFQKRVNHRNKHGKDFTPCCLIEVDQRFGKTYCLHLQRQRYAKQATGKTQAASLRHLFNSCGSHGGKI
jgi:hypothetical protein